MTVNKMLTREEILEDRLVVLRELLTSYDIICENTEESEYVKSFIGKWLNRLESEEKESPTLNAVRIKYFELKKSIEILNELMIKYLDFSTELYAEENMEEFHPITASTITLDIWISELNDELITLRNSIIESLGQADK